ncbi:uncharacterized protein BDR25DRAFT_331561 [Lindgomyces ingoldianus]|uniref:Uncharacterized protein n=1 Tax=Lindgomyces ingoldianus TaxID=673940 RepID=A0ACB6R9R5_9PLEO|nr:uncharacterized protein BDR25DRAFT_331561 [Lindgomyces ingoldianus]KAF2475832.1 hypothetical protein BDR25DRAFT_331561 [Lindgomyces ingoldianus]
MSHSTSQPSSSAATSATTNLSRCLSIKTTAKSAQNTNPFPPSDIKLFVTNLRLLDLDLRADWPNITVQTFSSKNADQKQRIGGVEWALFRLLEIWDPVETSQKLQPFFPPLEPLQSLNLRAALYRCLNELKKIGILGRESVLRKTMLDECKGEKFYEILALFSTAVLKKHLAAQRRAKRQAAPVARKLSTDPALPRDQQASLLPLAIAHKAALTNILRRKHEKRTRYTQFDRLLQEKAATPRYRKSSIPQNDTAAIKKQLRDNWIGNQKWLDTMLHGDDIQVEDAFLNRPFKDVWRMVQNGRKLQDASPDTGLLENLQSRVQEQQARLQKWKRFHEKLREEVEAQPPPPRTQALEEAFRFDDHLKLQLRSTKPSDMDPVQRNPLSVEYQDIISEMESELLEVSKARNNRSTITHVTRRGSSFSTSPTRRRKSRSDSASKRPTSSHTEKLTRPAPPSKKQSKESMPPPSSRREPTATPTDSDATLVGHPSISLSPLSNATETTIQNHFDGTQDTSEPLPMVSTPPRLAIQTTQPRSPSPPPSSYFPSEPPVLEPPSLSHEDLLAEQILSSVANATPSPVKKQPRLSLVERTRMSMAHANSFPSIDESPPDSNPLPSLSTIATAEPPAPLDRRTSLLERTRLSMAAMSQNPQAAQRKKDKRKSLRTSLYPINQFDTPRNRKSIHAIEEARSGERTPKEELFSDEVDYERVFKSRPKIAQSPVFSPEDGDRDAETGSEQYDEGEGKGGGDRDVSSLGIDEDGTEDMYDEGVTGVDLADVDADEDEDGFTQTWENSPSRRVRGGRST